MTAPRPCLAYADIARLLGCSRSLVADLALCAFVRAWWRWDQLIRN